MMHCKKCHRLCETLYECDCAEYSELCEYCWRKVPTRHREDVCFVDWLDYNYVEETRPETGFF
jgi:hypothetical protein